MGDASILVIIGGIGGILSGFLGIGGGVILIPLLIYWGRLSVKVAASVSMVFIICSSLSGLFAHRHNIDLKIGLRVGISSILGALAGAYLSGKISDILLKVIFIVIVLAAAFMLLFPKPENEDIDSNNKGSNKYITVFIGLGQGMLTGLLGIGGGFIVIPLMMYFLGMSTIIAIGTSLMIILFSGLSGFIVKAATSQMAYDIAFWVVLGALPGAQFGGWLAHRCKPRFLQISLFIVLIGILIRMVWVEFLI